MAALISQLRAGPRCRRGRELRRDKPPTWLADWHRTDAVDPVAILGQVAQGRFPAPRETAQPRDAASAFSFLRGAAAVMGADLAGSLAHTSGIDLGHLRGDAHLANFGGYFSPSARSCSM